MDDLETALYRVLGGACPLTDQGTPCAHCEARVAPLAEAAREAVIDQAAAALNVAIALAEQAAPLCDADREALDGCRIVLEGIAR